jgi:hypothetical protein
MQAVAKSIPFAVPAQPSPNVEPITQNELSLLLSLRGRLSQLESQVESAEQSIKQRLEQGAEIEQGNHTVKLEERWRRNVAWKDVVIRLALRLKMDGAAYCARVLAATKPTRTMSLEVS